MASIQRRTSLIKFAHLDEKSEEGSISNLSTKVVSAVGLGGPKQEGKLDPYLIIKVKPFNKDLQKKRAHPLITRNPFQKAEIARARKQTSMYYIDNIVYPNSY